MEYAVVDKSKKKKKKGDKQQNVSNLHTIRVRMCTPCIACRGNTIAILMYTSVRMFCMMCNLILFHQISFSDYYPSVVN